MSRKLFEPFLVSKLTKYLTKGQTENITIKTLHLTKSRDGGQNGKFGVKMHIARGHWEGTEYKECPGKGRLIPVKLLTYFSMTS